MPVAQAVPLPRAVGHVALTTGVVVLGYLAATLLAYAIAGPTGSTASFLVAHTVAACLLLLLLTRWRAGAGLAAGLPAVRWTGPPVLGAYLLLPTAWVGRALAGRVLLGDGVGGFVLDLLVWAAVGAAGLAWACSQVDLKAAPTTPYG